MELLNLRCSEHSALGGILEVGELGKGSGKKFRQRPRHTFNFDEQVRATVFPQQLTASSTRRDVRVVAHADDGNEPATATHVQLAEHRALGAQCETV